jgi:peroxiredoxin
MKHIENNQKAINFSCNDYLGNPINLSDYKGKKVLLSFFRGAACPFCNLRVHQLIQRHKEFEQKGINIISFFAATAEQISEYAGKQSAPFVIIPDASLEVYKQYGIEQSKSGMYKAMLKPMKMMKIMFSGFFNMKASKDKPIIPADFLIDENQNIIKTYYGKDFGDHLPIQEILNWNNNN